MAAAIGWKIERMRGRGGVYGGVFFLFWDGKLNCKKNYKIKYNEDLRWPPFYILHVTTNEKHAGMTEGGWDRPRDRARTLGEHDGNDEPLAEGDDNDDDKYGKDGNIPDDDDEYVNHHMRTITKCVRGLTVCKFFLVPTRMHFGIPLCVR